MTNNSGPSSVISTAARALAVQAVLAVQGVQEVHAPVQGLWENVVGKPQEPYEALLVRQVDGRIAVDLDLSIESDAIAVDTAAEAQQAISRVLAAHGLAPDAVTITVAVL